MAHRKVEEEIARLSLLREAGAASAAGALRKALADRVNLVVAKAAKLAAEMQIRDLVPDLLRAFDRLMENAAERDPQCWGKNAVANALKDLDHRESAAFMRGMRHVQMEAVWGGRQDTAQTLRGICLLALPTCADLRRSEILRCLVDALADAEQVVRVEAVRALAQMEGDECALLLRLKAHAGDKEAAVAGQVFDALLTVERDEALPFVGAFLGAANEEVRQEAALALGSSRLPGAVDLLEHAWTHNPRDPQLREALLRALSASRQPRAIEFLLDLLKKGRERETAAALEALAIHRHSPEIRRQVQEAVSALAQSVRAQFERLFATD
ncbi:MAG: HEAT repeat domain-containing protein [Acidobacteriia bacterium]|nr:HEAT repeat domain-containing protein [Terriglobia bacterium]